MLATSILLTPPEQTYYHPNSFRFQMRYMRADWMSLCWRTPAASPLPVRIHSAECSSWNQTAYDSSCLAETDWACLGKKWNVFGCSEVVKIRRDVKGRFRDLNMEHLLSWMKPEALKLDSCSDQGLTSNLVGQSKDMAWCLTSRNSCECAGERCMLLSEQIERLPEGLLPLKIPLSTSDYECLLCELLSIRRGAAWKGVWTWRHKRAIWPSSTHETSWLPYFRYFVACLPHPNTTCPCLWPKESPTF